jgi:hypothetical protein
LRAGISIAELTSRRFQRVFHGVYLPAGVLLTPVERARAALWVSPSGSYASHHTAASIWKGTPPDDARTHVSVPGSLSRSQRRGIAAHRALDTPDLRRHRGIAVSSPAQCFCELATDGADLVALVTTGDSLVAAGAARPDQLIAAAGEWTRKRAAVAQRAARLVRSGVDSPKESRLRMLVVLAGLPEPQVNVVLRYPNGDWRRRFDLCYRDLKLGIEYDGRQHLTDAQQWARDIERREELEREGWRIVVVQAEQLYTDPARVLDRIVQARLDRGAPRSTCRIRMTWTNYFRP